MWISQPASSLDEKQYTLQVFNGNWMENGIEMENGNEKLDNAFATMQKNMVCDCWCSVTSKWLGWYYLLCWIE